METAQAYPPTDSCADAESFPDGCFELDTDTSTQTDTQEVTQPPALPATGLDGALLPWAILAVLVGIVLVVGVSYVTGAREGGTSTDGASA